MSRSTKVVTLLLVLATFVALILNFVNVEALTSVFSEETFKAFLASDDIIVTAIITLAAGFMTALSPCVYPIIPITLSVIGARRYESAMQGFLVSLSYVAGMVALYVVLGILFSSVGILFGSVYQQPWVLVAVGALFLFFAFSMFGLLNWTLPDSLMKRLSTIGGSGVRGAFLMGLVAGLIASPCTGPVLASILTLISRQGGLWSGSLLMVIYGIGMGIPFLILGTFSSALARMPKSGAWMNVVKVIFSVSMLCASSYYLYLGAKGLIAQSQETGFDAYAKLEDDLSKAKSAKKPVIIDFYADWCTSCKEIEEVTFHEARVAQKMREFEVIRIDISNPTPSQNKIADRFGVTTLPLILFFDRDGKLVDDAAVRGFIGADQFLSRLEKVQKNPG